MWITKASKENLMGRLKELERDVETLLKTLSPFKIGDKVWYYKKGYKFNPKTGKKEKPIEKRVYHIFLYKGKVLYDINPSAFGTHNAELHELEHYTEPKQIQKKKRRKG